MMRTGLILDFFNKYINNIDDVYKIEKIKVNLTDANTVLE